MDNPAKSATAVKDPVCGMTVHPASARYRLEHAGKTHYFCSNHCVEKFKADPEKYLNQPAQFGSPSLVMLGGQPASTHAPAAAKVKDPVCGMDVDPATAKHKLDYAGKTSYFCSARCLEKFRANSDAYLAPPAAASAHTVQLVPAPAKVALSAETQVAASPAKRNYVC